MAIDGAANASGRSGTEKAGIAGKYMTFKLAAEEYGLQILKVREIIGVLEITRVARSKPYIRGIINLRGKVIPVVDLRIKFEMPPSEIAGPSVIIVVQYSLGDRDVAIGVLVDEVLEVLSLPQENIEPPPDFGTSTIESDFILGIGKHEGRIIFLLDIGRVLSDSEAAEVSTLA